MYPASSRRTVIDRPAQARVIGASAGPGTLISPSEDQSPEGCRLLCGLRDRFVRLWNWYSRASRRTLGVPIAAFPSAVRNRYVALVHRAFRRTFRFAL